MKKLLLCLVAFASLAVGSARAGVLDDFSSSELTGGLKDALEQGIGNAVSTLGHDNGFLGNARVKIPLPDPLKRIERGLRMFGMGDQADELVNSMNHAAEQAVPQAQELLVGALKKMTVKDVQAIFNGGKDSATKYFRASTEGDLRTRFLPIVTQVTSKVGLAQRYDSLAGQAKQLGLLKGEDASVEQYVTNKALDGLFLMMADEEQKIRDNPVKATSDLAKRIFDVLRQ